MVQTRKQTKEKAVKAQSESSLKQSSLPLEVRISNMEKKLKKLQAKQEKIAHLKNEFEKHRHNYYELWKEVQAKEAAAEADLRS
jgi:hypothetical protein